MDERDCGTVEPVEVVQAFLECVPVMTEVFRQWNRAGKEGEEFCFAGYSGWDDDAVVVLWDKRLGLEVKRIHGNGMKV